ncbi:MAG: 23S rRNA (adenine(2503)-C(2))-methyltransferase RlmN [Desulfobulbaceae bacterium]|nr:23S rRNA (adenine(2503)-C(2))-methyltransferase RlmN [Desulfobulbaceae bacterium]
MEKIDLKDFSLRRLTDLVTALGLPAFRARQIFFWIYRPGTSDFEQMTNLSKELRATLAAKAAISSLTPAVKEVSEDGTVKYGFRLEDGLMIESVLIPEESRNTLCISSQVGCAMGCRFCLTGTMGFKRNLRPAEIVNQVTGAMEEMAAAQRGRLTNLVFMGMGEPLANFDNLIESLEILMDPHGLDFSSRRITVSTCGLVPRIPELGEKAGVNLAISLHSVNDRVRSALMPVNDTYGVDLLLDTCRNKFPLAKRRRIMFEYTLLMDVNDSLADARELARKLHGIRCKINLLSYNPCPALPFQSPAPERVEAFQKILLDAGYSVFIRSSRGADISAACGQLATKNSGQQGIDSENGEEC